MSFPETSLFSVIAFWGAMGLSLGSVGTAAAQSEEKSGEQPEVLSGESNSEGTSRVLVSPPRLLEGEGPTYPVDSLSEAQVVLIVTISAEGRVEQAEVESVTVSEEGEPTEPFERAALEAVRRFVFAPALRGETALAARIRVPFRFLPEHALIPSAGPKAPAHGPQPSPAEPSTEPDEHEHDPARGASNDPHLEVTVHGERTQRAERRAASDVFIHREVLSAAPRQEGADVLRVVPGLTVFRSRGLAIGPSYTLRGFDSEHGQDIEFRVGGLPINLPSHIHGQGYADLSFLVGEVVDEVRVSAGVSDPKQGDFAVAGTIEIGLGVDEEHRGLSLKSGYGSFDTYRQLVSWSPKDTSRESLGAVQVTDTAGFGQNRAGQSASGVVQHRFGEGPLSFRVIGIAHGARGGSAGVLRLDDVESGAVCYHCVYPYPTAQAQNAMNQRLLAGVFADYRGPAHANGSIGLWVSHDNFRMQQNFTGFLERSRTLSSVSGRGDLIEQRNETNSVGLTGRYRTEAFDPTEWAHGTLEVGTDARLDRIEQSQNLLDATVRGQTWDRRVDASVHAMALGLWGDLDWQFGKIVLLRAGVRADVLSYEANDRLGNFAPTVRPQDAFIPGYRRSSMGIAAGPRTSIEVRPRPWLSLLASYGEGYRSPQARTLEDGERAPFTKVHSGDAGVRLRFGEPLELTGAAFYTRLSDDVAFDATEGRMERIGATQRWGGTVYALSHPADWMVTALSVTYVHATLLEPPPATAEEPAPPFVSGQRIPFVPPLVVRLDGGVKHELSDDVAGHALVGRAGLGFSFLSGRPLPFNQSTEPVGLLDASLGLEWSVFQLTLDGYNLLNQNYEAQAYSFVSNWNEGAAPSRLPTRHFAAGAPLSFLLSLGVTL